MNVLNLLLPIMFVSVPTMFYDLTTLFRSGLIIVFSLIVLIIKPIDFKKNIILLGIFITIVIAYIISWLINQQSYTIFLFGAYGRNLGVLALIGIFLITLQSADYYSKFSDQLVKSFYWVLVLATIYGYLQEINADPLNWEIGAGKGSTLGNPNFSSALFGMLSIIPLSYFYTTKTLKRYAHLTLYALVFGLVIVVNSSQGLIIFIINLLLFVISKYFFKANKLNNKKFFYLVIPLIAALTYFIANLLKFDYIKNKLNSSLQIAPRLEHWKLGYNIWRDHPIFGVGLDNMQKYTGEYRSFEISKWGLYTAPDRSHNTLIDAFVFGGVIVGLATLAYFLMVFLVIVRLHKNTENRNVNSSINVLSLIWVGYFIQAFISPDHIFLTLCGMMAAGALIGIDNQKRKYANG